MGHLSQASVTHQGHSHSREHGAEAPQPARGCHASSSLLVLVSLLVVVAQQSLHQTVVGGPAASAAVAAVVQAGVAACHRVAAWLGE